MAFFIRTAKGLGTGILKVLEQIVATNPTIKETPIAPKKQVAIAYQQIIAIKKNPKINPTAIIITKTNIKLSSYRILKIEKILVKINKKKKLT